MVITCCSITILWNYGLFSDAFVALYSTLLYFYFFFLYIERERRIGAKILCP